MYVAFGAGASTYSEVRSTGLSMVGRNGAFAAITWPDAVPERSKQIQFRVQARRRVGIKIRFWTVTGQRLRRNPFPEVLDG